MLKMPFQRELDEGLQKNHRVAWILDKSFKWRRGAIELGDSLGNTYYYPTKGWTSYELLDTDTLKAFKELANCVESPALVEGTHGSDYAYGDIEGNKGGLREWLYQLRPQNYNDFSKVKEWIEKYGFPLATPSPSQMSETDALVIANLVSLAWKLSESLKTKTGINRIKSLANTCIFGNKTLVTFGIPQQQVSMEDYEGYIIFHEDLILHYLSNKPIPNKIWKEAAYLWIGRLCGYFIDVQIESRFSYKYRITPTLKTKTFLSWLWLHFIAHISEELPRTDAKLCNCGEEIWGRAKLCDICLREHNNQLKNDSRKILQLKKQGKTAEDISLLLGLPLQRVKKSIKEV